MPSLFSIPSIHISNISTIGIVNITIAILIIIFFTITIVDPNFIFIMKSNNSSMTEEEMLQRLEQSRESSKKGNYRNADDVISDMRGKYGL